MRSWALLLLMGAGLAQIGKPAGGFLQGILPPPGSQLQVEEKNGRLLAVGYTGPLDAAFLGRLAERATGMAFAAPLQEWMAKNAGNLKGQRVSLSLGEAFLLDLALTEPLRARIGPREIQETALGEDRWVLGERGPVLRIFSDFQCPFCQRLAREVLPQLKPRALKGELRISYRHFPLKEIHPQALPAAIAAECAGAQGAFWPYHDLLMQGRLGDYLGLARTLSLDPQAFAACLKDPQVAARVEAERALALRLGLRGTPSAFVGPYRVPDPFDLGRLLDYLALAR
ncbi:DsbA family protein [Thermus amyloliquefaciens]|uniref:DsbA family protein n=1 Tax=Thermus amyloliquefaciens TaxID=1449080 RepID=UPI0005715ABD|nr:thioredoxin domain-containing protein [Thermus amyloliquefaciens]